MVVLAVAVAAAVASALTCADTAAAADVVVELRAKWLAIPVEVQALEHVASFGSNLLFWSAFAGAREGMCSETTDADDRWPAIRNLVEDVLGSRSVEYLDLSVANNAHVPAALAQHRDGELAQDMPNCASVNHACLGGAQTFVVVDGFRLCDAQRVDLKTLLACRSRTHVSAESPLYSDEEHIYPPSDDVSLSRDADEVLTVILYGHPCDHGVFEWHNVLSGLARSGDIVYVYRFYQDPAAATDAKGLQLTGYGVEMAIKNTAYLAVDDSSDDLSADAFVEVPSASYSNLASLFPDGAGVAAMEQLRAHVASQHVRDRVSDGTNEDAMPDHTEMSLQAAAVVAQSATPLATLVAMSHNLPSFVGDLAKMHVPVVDTVDNPVGKGFDDYVLYLNANGLEDANLHQLLLELRSDSQAASLLNRVGVTDSGVVSRVLRTSANTPRRVPLDLRHAGVIELNNLETDRKYKSWESNYEHVLPPMRYQTDFRMVRKNIFNVVVAIDTMSRDGVEMLDAIKELMVKKVPFTFGVVLIGAGKKYEQVVNAIGFVRRCYGKERASKILMRGVQKAMKTPAGLLSPDGLAKVLKLHTKRNKPTAAECQGMDKFDYQSIVDSEVAAIAAFSTESGGGAMPLLPAIADLLENRHFPGVHAMFVNGLQHQRPHQSHLMHHLFHAYHQVLQSVQTSIIQGATEDTMPGATLVYGKQATTVFSTKLAVTPERPLDVVRADALADVLPHVTYLSDGPREAHTDNTTKAMPKTTVWVVGNFREAVGWKTLCNVAKHCAQPQPGNATQCRLAAIQRPTYKRPRVLGHRLTLVEVVSECDKGAQSPPSAWLVDEPATTASAPSTDESNAYAQRLADMIRDSATDGAANVHAVVNGRVVGVVDEMTEGDLVAIAQYQEKSLFLTEVHEALAASTENGGDASGLALVDKLLLVANLIQGRGDRSAGAAAFHTTRLNADPHAFTATTKQHALHQVVCVLDPLTRPAQRIVGLLATLDTLPSVEVHVIMRVGSKVAEGTVASGTTRYYRYVVRTHMGARLGGAVARFDHLNASSLYTMVPHVPEAWLLEVAEATHDMDNIYLPNAKGGDIHASLSLNNILIQGTSSDTSNYYTPGVQLDLLDMGMGRHQLADTLVMENLGYFQLKAAPGRFRLALREGKSRTVFTVDSYSGGVTTRTQTKKELPVRHTATQVAVSVTSFGGAWLDITLKRREGHEHTPMISVEDHGLEDTDGQLARDDTIHIFSIASGHLYERLLRIMMVSVMKMTTLNVKFWFLKTCGSPDFKFRILPAMAKLYGFDYELIEYQWPSWLRRQELKMREIWAYKLLFLDVLFPLKLHRVIFVDADQVVRADLGELMRMDLQGAAYGYVPMGSDRADMEGFRFWNTGWWKQKLDGLPYHISALYVIDLVRFRLIAAGDKLRGTYQQLSADPGSLSNLDQDLPNHMNPYLKIFSLPQEWLWCESWCSNDWKEKAKTIDLCNNPMTKEPKLDSARRIIVEWSDYDREVKDFIRTLPPVSVAEPGSGVKDEL